MGCRNIDGATRCRDGRFPLLVALMVAVSATGPVSVAASWRRTSAFRRATARFARVRHLLRSLVVALALLPLGSVWAAASAYDVLIGRWVRPDGGYTIAVRSIDADGKLDAAYANPAPLPFAVAQAKRDGTKLTVFLELRAGGYNGSTYTLAYDPASDSLKGRLFPGRRREALRRGIQAVEIEAS